tara:strand:- start:332 stop:469 length:138 start_codon:yes stop_codon:yes gene_type:complete
VERKNIVKRKGRIREKEGIQSKEKAKDKNCKIFLHILQFMINILS